MDVFQDANDPQPRIEVAPASIAIQRHRQAALRALDADYAGVSSAGAFYGVGLDHGVVLLPDPALATDIFRSQQALQILRQIGRSTQADVLRHVPGNGRLPAFHRPSVERSV